MKKKTIVYRCSACGHVEPKWLGRCPACGEWNSLKEGEASAADSARETGFSVPLSAVDPAEGVRVSSGSAEMDRVLGGGVMKGSSVLVAGEPGIGKSTLLLQVAARAESKGRVLYVSGEESAPQIRLRADRLGLGRDGLEVFCSGELEAIIAVLEKTRPSIVIVDSMQTLRSDEAGSVPGTVNQVKYCGLALADWAKRHGAAIFLVAHVTKDGQIAGPKAAEHMVDTVLSFEQSDGDVRILRSTKNRFGSTDEVGLFTMGAAGLQEVADPSSIFLVRREGAAPAGTAVAAVWEGSRCILVEVQALVVPSKAAVSRVNSDRIDPSRVARIAAVLERHAGVVFSDRDIFVNVAGGMRIAEPGVDLAVAAALHSARSDLPPPDRTALFGELSLAGEVRPVKRARSRVKASRSLGYETVYGPKPSNVAEPDDKDGADAKPVEDVKRMIHALFGGKRG